MRFILAQHHFLAQTAREGGDAVGGFGRGGKAGDDFDQAHHGDRIEEVQPDEARRIGRMVGHAGDRDRRCVRRHDRAGVQHLAGVGEDRVLDLLALGRGFDDQIGLGEGGVIGNRRDAGKQGFGL
jgi:hypothetical protein